MSMQEGIQVMTIHEKIRILEIAVSISPGDNVYKVYKELIELIDPCRCLQGCESTEDKYHQE